MALINCSNCSGMVSTKAPACPHCGCVPVRVMSDQERPQPLADEQGAMSAALPSKEVVETGGEEVQAGCPGKFRGACKAAAGIVGLILVGWIWYNIGLKLAVPIGFAFSAGLKDWREYSEQTTKIKYSTGDIILYSVLGVVVAAFFVPAACMLIIPDSQKSDSTSQRVPVTNGTDIPLGNWRLEEAPRAFGTRPEHYSLDQYMRVPESGSKPPSR